MGRGLGSGYHNLILQDPYIHSLSAKGVKLNGMVDFVLEKAVGVLKSERESNTDKAVKRLERLNLPIKKINSYVTGDENESGVIEIELSGQKTGDFWKFDKDIDFDKLKKEISKLPKMYIFRQSERWETTQMPQKLSSGYNDNKIRLYKSYW